MDQDHDHVNSAERLSPPPSLHHARDQSKATWARDLQGLYEHAKDRFADVKWIDDTEGAANGGGEAEYLRDGDGSIGAEVMDQPLGEEPSNEDPLVTEPEAIFAHKAIVYARAPKAFKERFFPILLASDSNLASVTAQSSVSSVSVPNLLHHALGTERSTSRNSSSSQRPLSRLRGVSFSQSTSQLNFDRPGSNGQDIAPNGDSPSGSTRPATATSHLSDAHRLAPNETDNEGRLTLSHHDMPEMLKQGLQWLYTAEGSLDELSADQLGTSISGLSSISQSQEILGDDMPRTTGLISAKGVNGKNSVQDKKLTISRMRLAQVSSRVKEFADFLTGVFFRRI